jgi:hypothetical protein
MPLEAILVRLVGIHRRFIARCYRRGCPAATPDCMHNSVRPPGSLSAGGLAGFVKQLDISHGSPRDERSPGAFFFGVFFFDCFYGESTGVVVDQPSLEAAPSGEPHGYSLSVPLLRQVPGQRASPVRLHSPGILHPHLALSRPS